MNDQPMLRTYSPDAFDWLKDMLSLKIQIAGMIAIANDVIQKKSMLPKQGEVLTVGTLKIPVNAYSCRFR